MEGKIRVRLEPLGVEVEAARGETLRDLLFAHGLEFPCGGRGACKGCRVKILRGAAPAAPEELAALTAAEIAEGWRLGCRIRPQADIALEIAQWEAVVLCDDTPVEFTPREGLGIAVDLGTTTLVAQLVDLQSGHVLGVQTALNPQAAYGSDVMSRVEFAVSQGGAGQLKEAIRRTIGGLVAQLSAVGKVHDIVIVGNTVMHHLFCGIDVEPLSHVPFQSPRSEAEVFSAGELGWNITPETSVKFLPCLGGFVGSDILAGILATRIAGSHDLAGLIDLGTNGEIVFGNRERMVCASTAAGPAFEGGRIAMGMRAATGAIASVQSGPGGLQCEVLGGGPPRGICGSGLVDAVAVGLELGAISPGGRLPHDVDAGSWSQSHPIRCAGTATRQGGHRGGHSDSVAAVGGHSGRRNAPLSGGGLRQLREPR